MILAHLRVLYLVIAAQFALLLSIRRSLLRSPACLVPH